MNVEDQMAVPILKTKLCVPSVRSESVSRPHLIERLEADMKALGKSLVEKHPDVGAVVCECTNFVPFNRALQKVVKVPVFDIVTLVHSVCEASVRKGFHGFI